MAHNAFERTGSVSGLVVTRHPAGCGLTLRVGMDCEDGMRCDARFIASSQR